MLKYSEIKTALYNSTEIQQIPDKWEESIPFFCKINEEELVAFLYWNVSDSLVIKQLIGINRKTGKVLQFKAKELSNIFGIPCESINPMVISDYEKYFLDKECYEKIFSEFCNSDNAFSTYGREAISLFKEIVGTDLFERVFANIAKEYISMLS